MESLTHQEILDYFRKIQKRDDFWIGLARRVQENTLANLEYIHDATYSAEKMKLNKSINTFGLILLKIRENFKLDFFPSLLCTCSLIFFHPPILLIFLYIS